MSNVRRWMKCVVGLAFVVPIFVLWKLHNNETLVKALEQRSSPHTNHSMPSTLIIGSMYKCPDSMCTEYLSESEMEDFGSCKQKAADLRNKFGPIREGTCRFMRSAGRRPVALASFPGSGNTWLRGLLEKATGICTGALYCDCGLRTSGFTGEGVKGSAVIAVKVHGKGGYMSNQKLPRRIGNRTVFGAAILLIRNPRDALVAEWHRERSNKNHNTSLNNHYLSVNSTYFGNNSAWNNYIRLKGSRWHEHIVGWLTTGSKNPLHIVVFEDLKSNLLEEISKIMDFFNISYNKSVLRMKLKEDYTTFYRRHRDDFEHFTLAQKEFLSSLVNKTIATLNNEELSEQVIQPFLRYL